MSVVLSVCLGGGWDTVTYLSVCEIDISTPPWAECLLESLCILEYPGWKEVGFD